MFNPSSEQWEKIEKEFNMLFTDSHPGDSGIGGNDPQDPVYEISTGDPKEILNFFRTHWHNREGKLRGKIEGMKNKTQENELTGVKIRANNNPLTKNVGRDLERSSGGYMQALTDVLAILDKKE